MGDTSVYILRNVLEPWSSPETFGQCWKKTNCSCQCSFWLWVFLLFFPPSHTAFESRFCYANGFLPAAAELSTVGARKEPADTAREVGALFQAQQYHPSQPCWLELALCLCSLAWWGCSWAIRWSFGDVLPFPAGYAKTSVSELRFQSQYEVGSVCRWKVVFPGAQWLRAVFAESLQLRPNESTVLLDLVEMQDK